MGRRIGLGFIAYEVADAKGNVKGYVLTAPTSHVRVWDETRENGKLLVDVEFTREGTGGGEGSGGRGGRSAGSL